MIFPMNSLKISIKPQEGAARYGDLYIISKDFDKVGIIECEARLVVKRILHTGLPLLYAEHNGEIYISSNFSFFEESGIRLTENTTKVKEMLAQGYVMPPETLYSNIFRLEVGKQLIIQKSEGNISAIQEEMLQINFQNRLQSIRDIKKMIQSQIESSRECIVLFSGGLDSVILAKLAEQKCPKRKFLSTGFEFEDIDHIEKNYALSASKALGIQTTYQTYPIKELLLELPEIIKLTEEPVGHIQTLLLYHLLKENSSKEFNVLNGQCADALFGTDAQYLKLRESSDNNDIEQILYKDFINNIRGDTDCTMNCWAKCLKGNMAFPFISDEILNEILKLDWKVKLQEQKWILRQIARDESISEEIIVRKKGAFGPLSSSWGKKLWPLKSICLGYLPDSYINSLENDEKRYALWNAINYSIWKKIFIEKIPPNIIIQEISDSF